MQIILTLRTYLVSDLQNPHVKIPIWQDTHIYETQISGETVLHKVYEVLCCLQTRAYRPWV